MSMCMLQSLMQCVSIKQSIEDISWPMSSCMTEDKTQEKKNVVVQ